MLGGSQGALSCRLRKSSSTFGDSLLILSNTITEVIRPIVLFAETAAERSRQTGVERTVVGDKARRFVLEGMLGLTDRRAEAAGRKGHSYPEAIAGYIVYLKQLYPPIHLREIARIVQRKFGYKTNHHTLKQFLEPYNTPIQLELGLTTFFHLCRCVPCALDGGPDGV